MKDSDKAQFSKLLKATLDLYGVRPSADAVSLWWAALEKLDFSAVRSALSEHIQDTQRGKFTPKPADVLSILQSRDGWIGAEQAWAIVFPTLRDESVTVFWTKPMQIAFGVALNLQDDEVAARMAFKEVYVRELGEARRTGLRPTWQMSPGTSAAGRQAVIEEAVRLGRLAAKQAADLLPHDDDPMAGRIAIAVS